MADTVPPWLLTMRSISGVREAPGAADNPVILRWAQEIGERFPQMKAYSALYKHDAIAWCGLTVAYCMAGAGIEPPFGVADTEKYLWAKAWAKWGKKLDKPIPGCVMVFTRTGGGHVAILERESPTHYIVRGGNQSDAVNEAAMPKASLVAAVWPPGAAPVTTVSTPPAQLAPIAKNTYDEAIRRLLQHEGGYTNHPSDPGGPTNFGITLADYRKYIKASGTAADVRAMTLPQAKAIYKSKYWNAMNCDALPAGVDYAVFDYGVNSGIGRAPKVLQRIVKVDADGQIGPVTIAAVRARDPKAVINAICDERLAFLKALKTWPVFGNGWGRRVSEVRAAALAMATANPPATAPAAMTVGQASDTSNWFTRLFKKETPTPTVSALS